MARGQTWSEEEVKALIEIWSDENISQLLVTTHKNEVFKIISGKMEAAGFTRTVAQCRTKVKKLRQQYIKIRDMLRKSGSSGDEKDKFPLYDELDAILGTRPTSSPQHIVESYHEEAPPTPASLAVSESDSTEQDQESEKSDRSATDFEVEETPTTSSLQEEERSEPKVAVPGAQKRKKKTDRFEKMIESYLDEKKKMDEDECKRMKQESTSFENFLKMQQQAKERRFQLLQEQQRANNQMFFQMMGTFLHAAVPQPMTPQPMTLQWMPPNPVRPPVWPTPSSHNTSAHTQHTDNSSSFITHQHHIPSTHHTVPAPPQTPPEPYMTSQHPTSSVLSDVNRDFFEL